MKIKDIQILKNLSSQGNETIKTTVFLEDGREDFVVVPAGISAGKYEAKNVSCDEAIRQTEAIKNDLLSIDWNQESLDAKLVSLNLGGNTSLAISAVFWKINNLGNKDFKPQKFPKLLMLLFEGGKHGNPNLTIQEFMIAEESLEKAIFDFKKMKQYLVDQKIETMVGAEGGFSPLSFNNDLVLATIKTIFPDARIALDTAGSFRQETLGYKELLEKYNIFYLEDPFSDEDWEKWSDFYNQFSQKILVVGDDLTVTNPARIQKALKNKVINAVIIKPNQNGTISGTLEAIKLARENGLKIVVSHRGDETDDDWIVDFAIYVQADYVKFGGMDRGERIAKYNRLLELGMK